MSIYSAPSGVTIVGTYHKEWEKILSYEALRFVASLHRQFDALRLELLERRKKIQKAIDDNRLSLNFLSDTRQIREDKWEVAALPQNLPERKVEILGTASLDFLKNAVESGADGIIIDLEDSLSPSWENIIESQIFLFDFLRQKNDSNTSYQPLLHVRPRGIHLWEKHVHVDGKPLAASLFDFGLYVYHNAKLLVERQSGPFFIVPKIENFYEAEFWSSLFSFTENALSLPSGSIRATIIIETITAVFEMEEILHSMKNHGWALSVDPRDYVFSVIKKFRKSREALMPDRSEITMDANFLHAYRKLLVETCQKRRALAIGGVSLLEPSVIYEDAELFEKIKFEKERDIALGMDGCIVNHPKLVPVVREAFKNVSREAITEAKEHPESLIVRPEDLLDFKIPGAITESGVRSNISLLFMYLSSWLSGHGAVDIFNLKEDVSSAEIARSQLWQWVHLEAEMDSEIPFDKELFLCWKTEEKELLKHLPFLDQVDRVIEEVVLTKDFVEFLTLITYEYL
ncbi:malate synthase [Methylacidiphilum kamchatkense]|uniref:malate synthase n=1 Tax=Methylacidiphilum kamchatkense TaxID=431057 RepID=UPI00068E78F7|nr:malate synthase [Methylacidiphilum kamchatkense]